jgi:hypothetical protein
MACGIYEIAVVGTDKRYIGANRNISTRWRGHLWALRTKIHRNLKLQALYDRYGETALVLILVEECPACVLKEREHFHLERLKSSRTLLNIKHKGQPLSTEHRARISAATAGKRKGPNKRSKQYTFYNPAGMPVVITCLRPFCEIHALSEAAMVKLSRGDYSQHKGWRRYDGRKRIEAFKPAKRTMSLATRLKLDKLVYSKRRGKPMLAAQQVALTILRSQKNARLKDYSFYAPNGALTKIHGLAPFCRQENLSYRHMMAVTRHERKQHKGWTLAPGS